MTTSVYVHPTLPAVIRTYSPGFDFAQGITPTTLEDIALLDAQSHKVYYIVDIPDLMMNVDDMITWAGMIGRSEVIQKKYKHPNVIENLMIVTQRMMELAAQNLNRPSMGAVKFKTFQSLEQALAYIQEQLGAGQR